MTQLFSPMLSRTSRPSMGMLMLGRSEKMNRLISLLLMALIALVGLVSLRPATAQTRGYTVTDLGVIPGAGSSSSSQARAINDSGWVVGDMPELRLSTPPYKGWLWTPGVPNAPSGSLRTLEPLYMGSRSGAYDVNNAGLVVGSSWDRTSGTVAATFWQGPDYTPREFNSLPRDPSLTGWSFSYAGFVSDPVDVDGAGPGEIYEIYVAGSGKQETPGEATFAGGIVWRIAGNSIAGGRGTIVGVTKLSGYDGGEWGEMNSRGQVTDGAETEAGSGVFQAFLWDGISGSGTRLGTLGGTNSFSNGINDYGTVVGSSSIVEGGSRGFVWSPAVPNGGSGTMVALSTLGGTRSWANGINNWNQIVGGAYLKGDRTRHACLWQNGAIQDLNSLKVAGATGLELLDAYRINNRGGIIGRFSTSKGYRACLLTPR